MHGSDGQPVQPVFSGDDSQSNDIEAGTVNGTHLGVSGQAGGATAGLSAFDPLSMSRTHTPSAGSHLFGTAAFRISVSDNGPGIPIEHQSKIFSAYKQVQSARIQQGRGTGLGLQISKSIVELHGGRIGFTTVPGRGTDFCQTHTRLTRTTVTMRGLHL